MIEYLDPHLIYYVILYGIRYQRPDSVYKINSLLFHDSCFLDGT